VASRAATPHDNISQYAARGVGTKSRGTSPRQTDALQQTLCFFSSRFFPNDLNLAQCFRHKSGCEVVKMGGPLLRGYSLPREANKGGGDI